MNQNVNLYKKGFVLIISLLVSIFIMTSFSIWYQSAIFQSFVSKQLIQEKIYHIEAKSLLPMVKEKIASLPNNEKEMEVFFTLQDKGHIEWNISKSKLFDNKIKIIFQKTNTYMGPVNVSIIDLD